MPGLFGLVTGVTQWLDRIDPGTNRRIKGLRLVTAYGIAALIGQTPALVGSAGATGLLGSLAGGFALWASVFEARIKRSDCSRDLLLLCVAAGLGAASFILGASLFAGIGPAGPELTLATGAFCVGYSKRFGILGAGIGAQFFIGQLLAYTAGLGPADLGVVTVATAIATLASIVPRLLSGPAEHPALTPAAPADPAVADTGMRIELLVGIQSAAAALFIVGLNAAFSLENSGWAIVASTFVITNSPAGTLDRVRRRILGTIVGVPLGLACLPIAVHAPLLIWASAALAMVIYAMALPERYDIASGAFAFTLVVTLEVGGDRAVEALVARAWETVLGGIVGAAAAFLVVPLLSRTTRSLRRHL